MPIHKQNQWCSKGWATTQGARGVGSPKILPSVVARRVPFWHGAGVNKGTKFESHPGRPVGPPTPLHTEHDHTPHLGDNSLLVHEECSASHTTTYGTVILNSNKVDEEYCSGIEKFEVDKGRNTARERNHLLISNSTLLIIQMYKNCV